MKRLSAVFSTRMGAVLASAALLSGCVVMPVEGGYRHHDRYENYESHDRYDLPPPAIPISWREVQGFAG